MAEEFPGRKKAEALPPLRVLPSDVRYALRYREAQLQQSEILDLVRNGFENEGLYVLLKGAQSNPEVQRSLIGELAKGITDLPGDKKSDMRSAIREFVEKNITVLPEGTRVEAQKLAQYSRQGFDLWEQSNALKAQEAARRTNPTFLVGHSMFVGLPEFIQSHGQTKKPLHTLIPSFIKSNERAMCGYLIANGSVDFLSKDFERKPESIVIDDTRQTGGTETSITDFWTADGKFPQPTFEYLDTASQRD